MYCVRASPPSSNATATIVTVSAWRPSEVNDEKFRSLPGRCGHSRITQLGRWCYVGAKFADVQFTMSILRWMYRGGRPNWLAMLLNHFSAVVHRLGERAKGAKLVKLADTIANLRDILANPSAK